MKERTTHKYLRKYKGKNGKWVYIYKETSLKDSKNSLFEFESIGKIANKIRNQKYETFVLFDNKGNVVFQKDGGEDYVKLDGYSLKKAIKRNKTTIHNHPKGSSFSWEDINIVLNAGHESMYVCSKKYDYKIEFDYEKINEKYGDIERFRKELANENLRANVEVRNKLEDMIDDGKITPQEAEILHENLVWNKIQDRMVGIKYIRREI